MDREHQEPTPSSETKKFVLKAQEKVPVVTSQGTLYVRHLRFSEVGALAPLLRDETDSGAKALGKATLRLLTNESPSPDDCTQLLDDVFESLESEDLRLLSNCISSSSDFGALPEGEPLHALGTAARQKIRAENKKLSDLSQNYARSLETAFQPLSEKVRDALKSNIFDLASIRENLQSSSVFESIEKVLHNEAKRWDHIAVDRDSRVFQPDIPVTKIPRTEETPMGRAAIAAEESARQIREVAGLTAAMASKMAELTETIVVRAVPEWLNKLDTDKQAAQKTLAQASSNLLWTKRAVVASILVTFTMTGWQLFVARQYKRDADAQQTAVVEVLRQQLGAAQQLNERLSEDFKVLQDSVLSVRNPTPAASSAPGPSATSAFTSKQSTR